MIILLMIVFVIISKKMLSSLWNVLFCMCAVVCVGLCLVMRRWLNQLDPKILKTPFSIQEDCQIIVSQSVHGNKWAAVAKDLQLSSHNSERR